MLISYEKQFLFIHVPKTAGNSLDELLRPHAEQPQQVLVNRLLALCGIHINYFGPVRWRQFRRHVAAAVVQKHLPAEIFQRLFKFAFVRNPWDALVSQYHYKRLGRVHHEYRMVQHISFEEFAYWWLAVKNKMRQKPLLCNAQGEMLMDFVGRFETLDEDLDYVLQTIGLNGRLGHQNPSKHSDYRTYYSDALAEFVGEQLAEDVELFGYCFDGIRHTPEFMQPRYRVAA